MMWQRARFLPPTPSPEPFWVQARPPEEHEFRELNEAGDGFQGERVKGAWYRTNVLEPNGHFFMWAEREGVELLAQFATEVEPDRRYLITAAEDGR